MHLDPPLRLIADALEHARAEAPPPADLDEQRAAAKAGMMLASIGIGDGVTTTDAVVALADREVPVRILRPQGVAAPAPALLYIHGGGWFQGDLDTGQVECGPLAAMVPCVVVLVDYRLAPEHPFPAALDDCVTVYEWIHAEHEALGVDPARIAVGGASAGGNLAAALCLALRDRGRPMPVVQLLEVPAVDLTLSSPSIREFASGAGLEGDEVAQFVRWYLGDGGDPSDPLVSPILAPDLSGLPPAVILVSELDPVRDDGERYLEALHDAGVPGAAVRVLAHFHGGWIVPNTMTHRLVLDLRAAAVRRALDGTLVPPLHWEL